MNITQFSLRHVQIPLRVAFSQASNTTQQSHSLVLECSSAEGVKGYGECCPRLYVTGEDHESVSRDVHQLARMASGRTFEDLDAIRQWVCGELPGKLGPSTICALEQALLDAWGKEKGVNVFELLGNGHKQKLEYSLVLPLLPPPALTALLRRFHFLHPREIKLKVDQQLSTSLENIRRIRRFYPWPVNIRIDANCSWTFAQAQAFIPALLEAGVHSFEQIFPAGMEECMGLITDEFGAQAHIMADESLISYRHARYLIENRLCNRFNLKISKLGGVFNSLRIYKLAVANGVGCQLGAHYGESSLLTAAGMLFSAMAPNVHVHEGGLGSLLLTHDLCPQAWTLANDCTMHLPQSQGYGMGVAVEEKLLENCSTLLARLNLPLPTLPAC
ncbi:MAG: hypothetical protein D6730_04970 [Bacteroidetes bacterium]|nr:MAG: hypothetical protein D6730_04970 [Bacteroidota bacterium]